MATETISIITYPDAEPPSSLEEGAKKALSTAPNWSDETRIVGGLPTELIRRKTLVRLDLPVETLERELQDLLRVMNRVFSQAELPGAESPAEPALIETSNRTICFR
jgi:hypothetical protein